MTHVAVMKIVMKEPHYLSDAVATLVLTRNVVINCPVKSRLSFCIFPIALIVGLCNDVFVVCVGVRLRSDVQKDFVQCVCWNPVSHQLASCSWDGTLLCTDVTVTTDNVAMNDH